MQPPPSSLAALQASHLAHSWDTDFRGASRQDVALLPYVWAQVAAADKKEVHVSKWFTLSAATAGRFRWPSWLGQMWSPTTYGRHVQYHCPVGPCLWRQVSLAAWHNARFSFLPCVVSVYFLCLFSFAVTLLLHIKSCITCYAAILPCHYLKCCICMSVMRPLTIDVMWDGIF